MPICRSTYGALTRSRITAGFSTSKTLVPFLYQTATIQQWKPTTLPIARRSASSRSTADDDIPFEGSETLPPSIDDAEPPRKTTITGSERAAFKKLYRKYSKEEQPQDDIPFTDEIDQIADEWYEEDDDKEPASLDSVFDAVLSGLPPSGQTSKYKKKKRPVETLKTLAESILRPEVEAARRKPREEVAIEAARIKGIREQDKARVQALLEAAQTDRELWEILEREVFDIIRQLDLDNMKKSISDQASALTKPTSPLSSSSSYTEISANPFPTTPTTTAWKPSKLSTSTHTDLRILFPNIPSHLIYAARLLRTNFPTSQLPLSILPTIKSLGRSSYALGATTSLYNILIRTMWHQHRSFDYIDELLNDMDNGGMEFDIGTVAVLDEVLEEYKSGRRGRYGAPIKSIWTMEQVEEGVGRLRNWRAVAGQRLGAWTERRASEGQVVRKFVGNKDVLANTVKGPSDEVGIEAARRKEKYRGGQYKRLHVAR